VEGGGRMGVLLSGLAVLIGVLGLWPGLYGRKARK